MIRAALAALFALCLSAVTAAAQTCGTYPNTLTNGTTADATQVMANFNFILNCVNTLNPSRGYIAGLTLSNDVGSPNTFIDVAAGLATSDDATISMTIGTFTENCNAAWAVGSGNGGLDSGSALAASTWYHLFLIERTDTNVVDVLCSTSASSPTFPTSYTKKRRIGSIKTDASSHIVAFTQDGDEFLWLISAQDAIGVTIGATNAPVTLTVPTGVKVHALFNPWMISGAVSSGLTFNSLDQTETTIIGGDQPLTSQVAGQGDGSTMNIRTNTCAQVRIISNAANTRYWINTNGWIDTRGRFN